MENSLPKSSDPTPAGVGQPQWSTAAIDDLLDRLGEIAQSASDPESFFTQLQRSLTGLGIDRVEVWHEGRGSRVDAPVSALPRPTNDNPPARIWPSTTGPVDLADVPPIPGVEPARIAEVIRCQTPSRPNARVMLVPWTSIDGDRGAVAIRWDEAEAARPSAAPRQLELAAAVAEIVARSHALSTRRELEQKLSRQTGWDTFGNRIHASLDLKETAYAIANEARPLIGCDRVWVLVRRGNRFAVAAVSGAEHVHRHSPSAQRLELLGERIAATGEPFWYSAADGEALATELPPQIAEPLGDYLDVAPATSLAIEPILPTRTDAVPSPKPIALIIAERFTEPLTPSQRETLKRVAPLATAAVINAGRVERIPGRGFWFRLADRRWLSRWPAWGVATAAITAAAIGMLLLVPADIRVRARGEIVPTRRQDVFAPRDGVVVAVLVDSGQTVTQGQPLLELRSTELDLESQRVEGELGVARQRLAVTRSQRLQIRPGDAESRARERRLTAEEDLINQEIGSLQQRTEILLKQREELTVRAPLGGQVLTWNTQQRLTGRPLRRGDSLLTIADIRGPWQGEFRVPARQSGRLLAHHRREPSSLTETDGLAETNGSPEAKGLGASQVGAITTIDGRPAKVEVALTTAPGQWIDGTLTQWSSRTQIDESGEASLLVTVDLDLPPNPDLVSTPDPVGTTELVPVNTTELVPVGTTELVPVNTPELVPGATAIASIPCGRGSLGEAWFYEFLDAVRLWLPF